MTPSRRDSANGLPAFNDNDEQQPFTSSAMPTSPVTSRYARRSSIAAIFDDRRREDALSKQTRPNLRRLWAKYDVPYVIGEEVVDLKRTLCETILVICSWCLIVFFFPFSLFVVMKIIQEYERAVIFRLGRLSRSSARGPGMCFILPCIDTLHLIDMRTVSFDVPPQEVLTRDSVTVAVDAVVYYRVFNPTVSIANVEHAQESTRLLAQTSLRNVLGTRLLSELLCDRGAVSNAMRECLDEATDNWGIKVERVEIKDVRLPKMLQRIMAAEAEAAREARAKVINKYKSFDFLNNIFRSRLLQVKANLKHHVH
jgi:erythrocyte band 7 integral membrane protein